MNNNYIPEWYITPFQHLKYTLVRNQDQLDILFDDLSDTDLFMSKGCDAQVDFYRDGSMAIVHIKESKRPLIEIHGLLLHEAVHIWQQVRELMGESEPSTEFEAYSIQAISQDLFEMYDLSEDCLNESTHQKR